MVKTSIRFDFFFSAFNSRRSIGVFAWGDSGTLRLVKGQ